MTTSREQICKSTSRKLAAALPTLPTTNATVGFDGFVDEIIAVVDKRHDKDRYDAVRTIEAMGQKILRAARQSSNYELLVKQTKLGGNGPIMANALAAMGLKVSYIGGLGYPTLHPVFAELAGRATVHSIAEPGHTDALEFDDGKLMFGKHQTLRDINWDNLISRVGMDQLHALLSGSKLIGMVNWTMLPHMSDIWAHMLDEVLPTLSPQPRLLFVDLADPEKRTTGDLLEAMRLLSRFQEKLDVILGLNLKESGQVAHDLGVSVPADNVAAEAVADQTAAAIRAKLNLACVVIHPRGSTAAATAEGSAHFAGPFVRQPKISTGAGDHFNAGFCLGRILEFELAESLCIGVATSGYYVSIGQSPDGPELVRFIATLPLPEN